MTPRGASEYYIVQLGLFILKTTSDDQTIGRQYKTKMYKQYKTR